MPSNGRSPDYLVLLADLRALSEAMLGAAQRGDWAALAAHETRRRELAELLPEGGGGWLETERQTVARSLIEACLRCDDQIHPLLAARVNELRVLLREKPVA